MENIHDSETQDQGKERAMFEPRYWTVLDGVDQPLCTYTKKEGTDHARGNDHGT